MNVTPSFKNNRKILIRRVSFCEKFMESFILLQNKNSHWADFSQTNQLTITRLSSSETFLPYLPLEENLFIASTIKERDRKSSSSRSFPGVPIRTCLTWSFLYFFYDF